MMRPKVPEALADMDDSEVKAFTAGLSLAYGTVAEEIAKEADEPKMSLSAVFDRVQQHFESDMADIAIHEAQR